MPDIDNGSAPTAAPRVRPTALLGFALGLGYTVLFLALEKLLGPSYVDIGNSAATVLSGIVIPLAICTVVTAGLTTWFGWWGPVLREKPLGVRWMWSIPVVLTLLVLVSVDWAQISALGAPYLMVLAVGTLLVGFNEEIVYRGMSLVAFRGAYKEVYVWLLTSLLFGLLHGANLFLGQALAPTIQQIGFAFVLGGVFYVVRRVTGLIVVPMVLHALWDFGSFTWAGAFAVTNVGPAALAGANLVGVLMAIRLPLQVAVIVLCLIAAKRVFSTPTVLAD
ncbi:MAG: CPBP family intramembrane metalloprotease [Coriobacteriia bacterium]|nr:CPBP family intramembrane metalloprotease [Coriobacteriia bacterium]